MHTLLPYEASFMPVCAEIQWTSSGHAVSPPVEW